MQNSLPATLNLERRLLVCEYCDPITKIYARQKAEYFSGVLINLAMEYKKLARGEINTHSDQTKTIVELSKEVIKGSIIWI